MENSKTSVDCPLVSPSVNVEPKMTSASATGWDVTRCRRDRSGSLAKYWRRHHDTVREHFIVQSIYLCRGRWVRLINLTCGRLLAWHYLVPGRWVRFVEECPDLGLDAFPAVKLAGLVSFLQSELLHDVLLGGPVRVQIQPVQCLQGVLRVAVGGIRHPAARLYLPAATRTTKQNI